MAWTPPKTWTSGAVTAAEFNEQVRDNLTWVKDTLAIQGIVFGSDVAEVRTRPARHGRSGSTNVATGTDTRLTLGSIDADWETSIGGGGSLSYNSNGTITIGFDGLCLVIANALYAADNNGWRQLWIRHDGSDDYGRVNITSAAGGAQTGINTIWPIFFTSGQTVALWARQNSGSTLSVTAAIRIIRIGIL